MNNGRGNFLFRITLWQALVINVLLISALLVVSKVWRDSLDRKDKQLMSSRNGHYVGNVTVDQVLLDPVSEHETARPIAGLIEFSIQSDFDVLGHYIGPGKLWVRDKLFPLQVTYLHVHEHAEDGAFTATIAIRTPRLDVVQMIDVEGKIEPPYLTFTSRDGNFSHAVLHKGTEAEFNQSVRDATARQ